MTSLTQKLSQLPGRAAEKLFGRPSQLEQFLAGDESTSSAASLTRVSVVSDHGDDADSQSGKDEESALWPTDSSPASAHSCRSVVTNLLFESEAEKKSPNCLKLSLYSVIFLVLICLLCIVGRDYIKLTLKWLERENVWLTFCVFLLLFTLTALPMMWGYAVLNVAAGYLYGWELGMLCTCVCALVGVTVCHVLVRRVLRTCVLARLPQKDMRIIFKIVEGKQGFKVVALSRLTPIPFGLQNALFSVTEISTVRYLAATMFGMLPTQGLNSYIGSTLRSMEDVLSDSASVVTGYLVFSVQLVITVVLTVFVVRKAKKELRKTVDKLNTEETSGGKFNKLTELNVSDDGHVVHHNNGIVNGDVPSTPKSPNSTKLNVFVTDTEEES